MKEYTDYVFVENAKTLGQDNIMEQVRGLFVGTKNYFFFFPEKATLFEMNYATQSTTKTTYTYEGKPVPEYVMGVLTTVPSVEEFEAFVTNEMESEIGQWIRIFPMEEISNFKVNAGMLGSGIVARFSNKEYSGASKFTATPVVLGLGKKKKDIRSFYEGHTKYIAK